MLHPLHTDAPDCNVQHQANIFKSLIHRLEVARSAHNHQLVERLEQEKRQYRLDRIKLIPFLLHGLQRAIQQIFEREQQIYEWQNGTDHGWFTFNPETGQGVWGDSEAELKLWLKERRTGHC